MNYNSLTAGTYEATKRHYVQNIENGLVSRVAFATLPDNFAGEIPIFKKFTPKQQANIDICIDLLEQAEGKISLPKTLKAIQSWCKDIRKLAMETQSNAIEMFYKRAAVMGTRAAAIAYILGGRKESKVVIDFALWVADYVLQQQVYLWGGYTEKEETEKNNTPVLNLYQKLPHEFTREELVNLRAMNGQGTNVRQIISRWKQAGMIQELEKNHYQKTQS